MESPCPEFRDLCVTVGIVSLGLLIPIAATGIWCDYIKSKTSLSKELKFFYASICPMYCALLLLWTRLGPQNPGRTWSALCKELGEGVYFASVFSFVGGLVLRVVKACVDLRSKRLAEKTKRLCEEWGANVQGGDFEKGDRPSGPLIELKEELE